MSDELSNVLQAGASYMDYKAQEEAAKDAKEAANLAAQEAAEAAKLAKKQLAEKHAADIALAKEQMAFEEEVYLESTKYVVEQIAKRDAQVHAAAIAGYSASGVDPYAEGSSALSVLGRIGEESLSEQERVMKGYTTFIKSRKLELSQLEKSTTRTFDWFMEQSKFELAYEIEARHAEADMYRKQAKYAKWGSYLGPASTLLIET